MGNAPTPVVEEIGHLRWLLQQAGAAVDLLTRPASRGHVVIDALFVALLIWIGVRFEMHAFLPGRLAFAVAITIVSLSLLGGLYAHLIARPLARRRRTAA